MSQPVCNPDGLQWRTCGNSYVVCGRTLPRLPPGGYTCAVDVTMRIEPGGRQEDRSMRKSFATFTPIGPYANVYWTF